MNVYELQAKIGLDAGDYNKGVKDTTEKGTKLKDNIKKIAISSDTLNSKLKVLGAQYTSASSEVDRLSAELNKSVAETGAASDESARLAQELSKAEAKAEGLRNEINSLTPAVKTLKDRLNSANEFGKSFTSGVENLVKGFFRLGAAVGGAVLAIGGVGVKFNAEIEQYTAAFTTLLGSEEAAVATINQIKKDAAATPFDVAGLVKANQLLLSTGENAEDSRRVILALGDAVSATGGGDDELSRMAQNLQQIRNVGEATAMDIKQFAFAGIDIYGLLADYTGKTVEEVQDLDISYEMLSGALIHASEEGGKFYGAMERQSRTMNGQISTLKDNVQQKLGEAFQKVSEIISGEVLPRINEFIENLDVGEIIDKIKELYNSFKDWLPVIIAVTTAIGTLYTIFKTMLIASSIASAFSTLGLAMTSLPIVFVVAAIAGLVAAIVYLWNTSEGFRNAVTEIWTAIGEAFNAVVELLYQGVLRIAEFFVITIPEAVVSAWEGFLSFLAQLATLPGLIGGYLLQALQSVADWALNLAAKALEAGQQFVTDLISGLASLAGELYAQGSELIDQLIAGIESIFSNLYNIGQNIVNQVRDGINAAWSGLVSWFNGLWNSLFGNRSVNVSVNTSGSHAGGLDYVPFNNYVANLHRGEMVLTAAEADAYRRGARGNTSGITIVQNIQAVPQTPVEIAAATQSYFEQARWAF